MLMLRSFLLGNRMKDLVENEDFVLVPNEDDGWDIRFLKGHLAEVVIGDIVIQPNIKTKNTSFSFKVKYTPDSDITTDNIELQQKVAYTITSLANSESLQVKQK